MGFLSNVNPFSEGNIDDNTNLAVLIAEYSHVDRRKYCFRNSCTLNGFTFQLEQKSHQRRICGEFCLEVPQLLDFIRVSVSSSDNLFFQ